MSAFVVDPVFTAWQGVAFAALMVVGVGLQFAFSPRRREIMGGSKFLVAVAVQATPAAAGVSLVRGAFRLGYLNDGRGFWEANLRSLAVMFAAVLAGQLAVRYLPPLSFLTRDLRRAGQAVWSARIGRWMGKQA